MFKSKTTAYKLIFASILVVVALISATVITPYVTSPQAFSSTLQVLDEKKNNAMLLTAAVTATSTAISTMPGDIATPLANELSKLSGPLLVITCIIYLEKYLLTTMGYIAFAGLLPLSCVFVLINLVFPKERLISWATKLLILALTFALLIPVSVKITSLIDQTFDESVSQTMQAVQQVSDEAEKVSGEEEGNALLKFFASIGQGVTNLVESAKNMLSLFVDAVAVLLITTCIMPVLTALLFIWIVKTVIGVPIENINIIKLMPVKRLPEHEKKKLEIGE